VGPEHTGSFNPVFCLPPAAYCLLLTAYCLLPIAYCPSGEFGKQKFFFRLFLTDPRRDSVGIWPSYAGRSGGQAWHIFFIKATATKKIKR